MTFIYCHSLRRQKASALVLVFRFPGAPGLSPRLLRSIRLANVAQLPVRLLAPEPANHIAFRVPDVFCQIIMSLMRGEFPGLGTARLCRRDVRALVRSEILAVWPASWLRLASAPDSAIAALSSPADCVLPRSFVSQSTAAFHMRALYPARD